jgi:hypothetical protein
MQDVNVSNDLRQLSLS